MHLRYQMESFRNILCNEGDYHSQAAPKWTHRLLTTSFCFNWLGSHFYCGVSLLIGWYFTITVDKYLHYWNQYIIFLLKDKLSQLSQFWVFFKISVSELVVILWKSCKSAVPNIFGTRDRFHGRQFFHRLGGGDGSGGNVSDGERWGAADEASLARPPLTSCCAAQFLTGLGPVPVRGPGVGDPWYKSYGSHSK